ncbi:hypothetical protein [Erythrobacter sp. Alg231-14]|uniref:hypothetical protein n=1 Tax=Erythrobacter sp. Alg231-14 TaxID=1922225 RepID=UPI000D557614
MRTVLLLAGALLTLAHPTMVHAQTDADDGNTISSQDAVAIDQALFLGEAIYRYDQAAWHTTDALREDFNDLGATGIRGWIINTIDGGLEAVFYRPTRDGFEAVWSGVYDGNRVRNTNTYDPGERAFTQEETAMVRAGSAPLENTAELARCSRQSFNRVVLPTGKDDGGFFVYFLVPQPAMNEIPFGGHYRFEVRDGNVVADRAFTNSCLTVSSTTSNGEQPVAIYVTHVLDPTPTEIHVFSMFAAGVPVTVMTMDNDQSWTIEIDEGKPRISTTDAR